VKKKRARPESGSEGSPERQRFQTDGQAKMGLVSARAAVCRRRCWHWSGPSLAMNKPVSPDRYLPRPQGTLTFDKDIAPIIFDRCAYCHRPGQAAPFTLLSFADVKKHAKQIAEVTAKGDMPPWLPSLGSEISRRCAA